MEILLHMLVQKMQSLSLNDVPNRAVLDSPVLGFVLSKKLCILSKNAGWMEGLILSYYFCLQKLCFPVCCSVFYYGNFEDRT